MTKEACEVILSSIYKTILDKVQAQLNNLGSSDNLLASSNDDADLYMERIFLSNSKDLVRLFLNYNLVHFYPQL